MKGTRLLPLSFVVVATLALATARDASACGMFVPERLEDTVPAIQQEHVAMIFDQDKELEHFVREVSFDAGNSAFGFIVPTPTQPTVAAEKSPFKKLRSAYPFSPPLPPGKGLGNEGATRDLAAAGAPPPVQVLSVQRVGKFKAFVLAATDASALKGWLSKNHFQVPPDSRAWLDHYVALGFFYVAFRYDPPKNKASERGLTSETVRVSFSTPHPYYPFLEPTGSRTVSSRLLEIWFISTKGMRPIAAFDTGKGFRPRKPWRSGERYLASSAALRRKLGKLGKLLPPAKKLVIQTFRDTKSSRRGWGDVLLVPERPVTYDARAIAKRERLLPVIDPTLTPEKPAAGGAK